MLKKFLRRIYHACWYLFAIAVLVSALFMTLIRIILPYAGDYREELQSLISRQTGYTVNIENIEGEWEGWAPIIRFDGIKISTTHNDLNITRLKSATIKFNPYASFKQGLIMPLRLTITGLDLTMVRGIDGALSVVTDTTSTTVPEAGISNVSFADWLFLQKTIAIKDARIKFIDARNQFEPILLTSVDLNMMNSATHMQINGAMVIPPAYGEKCSFALDLYGDITTPEWSGQIYFEALRSKPEAWLQHLDVNASLLLENTLTDIRIWSSWEGARLTKVNGAFLASRVPLALGAAHLDAQHVNALFALARDQDGGLRLKIRMKELRTGNNIWPVTEAIVIRQSRPDGGPFRYITHTDYINLNDLAAIAGRDAGAEILFASNKLKAGGILQDCLIVYDPELPPAERVSFNTRVRGLTLDNMHNLRVRNLDGQLAGNFSQGVFNLDTPSAEVTLPGILQKTTTLNELQGDLRWHANQNGLRLDTSLLQTHTPHFNAAVQGNIVFSTSNKLPFVDLLVTANALDLDNLRFYMPAALSQNTHAWIKKALVAGDVSRLDVILRGHMAEFPFDNHEGRFEAIAEVHKGTLDYHTDWVPADNIEAEVRLDGRSLVVDANSGNIYNAVITNTRATIADLSAHNLGVNIQGTIKGHTSEARTFIKNSPLSESRLLGEISTHDIDGTFNLDLGLHIPLHDMPLTYNGIIHFDDATFNSQAYAIKLDHIAGNVAFSENRVVTEGLTASFLTDPVNLIINTDTNDELYFGIECNLSGNSIADLIARIFHKPEKFAEQIRKFLDGASTWRAVLSPIEKTAGTTTGSEMLLRISSPLTGLAINLPAPLGKTYEAMPLEITTTISTSARKNIDISYGDSLKAKVELNQATSGMSLSRAELALGADTILSGEGSGIVIHGAVQELSLAEWYSLLDFQSANVSVNPLNSLMIDVSVETLMGLAGQDYKNTQFTFQREASIWRANLSGDLIEGNIFLPINMQSGIVKGAFSRLKINRSEIIQNHTKLRPDLFPPMQLTVDNFAYGDFNLGKLELNTAPGVNGMTIEKITFTQPGMTITGNGTWTLDNDRENSDFELVLQSDSLATMLAAFNYNTEPVQDGVSKFILKAQWSGAPMEFSLAGLTGSLKLKVKKGKFISIKPESGRLFGLLNLQTLIRLVSLDFSVLFSKGYAFDKIEGTFSLDSGNAYTNNLSVKGPSADIDVIGRTGLVDKDYDQIAAITPRALFGPIGMGLGAVIFLASEVFESIPEKIDALLRYQYTIRGTWDDPVVEKFNGEKTDEG